MDYTKTGRKDAKKNRDAKAQRGKGTKTQGRRGTMRGEFSQVVHYAMYTIFDHFFTEINHQSQLEVGESKIGESLSLE